MRLVMFVLMTLLVHAAVAETVYINDNLRVGVRTAPNSTETPVEVLLSGTKLQVLEHQGDYLRVRTPKGVEGWINGAYAVVDPPARIVLPDVEKERDALKAEVATLRKDKAADTEQTQQLAAKEAQLTAQNVKLQAKVSDLEASRSAYRWLYFALAFIAVFLGGIYLGVRWDKERIAQRLGGLEL